MASTIFHFRLSEKLKKALDTAAKKEPGGASELVRRAIAKELGVWSPDKGITL